MAPTRGHDGIKPLRGRGDPDSGQPHRDTTAFEFGQLVKIYGYLETELHSRSLVNALRDAWPPQFACFQIR